jgi:hypothetical protein
MGIKNGPNNGGESGIGYFEFFVVFFCFLFVERVDLKINNNARIAFDSTS